MVLEKADAVAALRTAIGATDPAQADAGTVRKLFAESKERNAIHAWTATRTRRARRGSSSPRRSSWARASRGHWSPGLRSERSRTVS